MSNTLRVQARDGVAVTFPRATLPGPGGRAFVLRGKGCPLEDGTLTEKADDPVDVPNDPFVRRRLKSSLVVVTATAPRPNARAAKSADMAAARTETLAPGKD